MVDALMPDAEKIAAIREMLPATGAGIYFDALAAGPFPAETARALAEADEWELRVGRAGAGRAEDVAQREEEACAVLAALLLGDPSSVVITHGVGEAHAQLALSLPPSVGPRWIQVTGGDESALAAMRGVAAARGAVVVEVAPEGAPALIGPGVGLVVLPHVDERTGAVLPIAESSGQAHAVGALVLLDASASVGAIPIDPVALDVDAVAFPAHRWLLGPEGVGGLWLGSRAQALVDPWALRERLDRPARRLTLGLARSLGWLEMYVGLTWAAERTGQLARALADALSVIDGVVVITPLDRMAGVVSFRVRGWTADEAREELGRRVFALIGCIDLDGEPVLRASVGFWNTAEESQRLAGAVAELAAHTPATIPRRPSLTVLRET
ncbi:MAG: aminotransferase class V-fold PLP-dependent enzyme [Chloroflexota bacterium]|nr:aminotransferase class V-fold PLP-dependent enzyme [Chloroflexota bacterium]